MAFTETVTLTEINDALEAAFGQRLRWQMDQSEYDDRLDYATHRVFEIINRPFYEDDLTDQELVTASQMYAENIQRAKEN